jgi:hypothetical protein
MRPLLPLIVLSLSLTGCSLIPKKVEFFQDKVHKFPEPTQAQKELQREAAQKANETAALTLHSALVEGSSFAVVGAATETEKLTGVVAESVGAPAKPTRDLETDRLIADLRNQLAKMSKKVDSFKEENNENSGKKIEGTGLIQVPYFAYAGGFLVVVLVGWHLAKTALTVASAANPGAAVGVAGMNVAGSVVAKGFHQLVQGGEDFKNWVEKEISDSGVKQKILDAFTAAHKEAQDSDVKTVVKKLI